MIPVLCYHRIGGPLELGVTRVSRKAFQRQMEALAVAGWRTVTLSAFADAQFEQSAIANPQSAISRQSAIRNPQSTILLSFDDGYASLAEYAYPLLADLGFTATTFLVTDFVGRENTWDVRYTWRRMPHLDWGAIEHWAGRGFEFGSHTATHPRLTWLEDRAATDELARSRATLVERLGRGAGRAVAFPFGATDPHVRALAKGAGYTIGFAGVRGDGRDPLDQPRLPVYSWDLGSVPLGLRAGWLGDSGRLAAHLANRCAVGTSWMLRLAGSRKAPGGGDSRL